MTKQTKPYLLWVDEAQEVASFHPVSGFEQMSFGSREVYQAKLWILVQAGFRFQ